MIMKTKLPLLKIDPDFQSLILPLSCEEYEQLELSIVADGCYDPIKVWRGYIIDGHKRYKICHEYDINFSIEVIKLNSKEDAISWICVNMLDNREMPENFRWYLIGKKCFAEKAVGVMNISGTDQYTIDPVNRKHHSERTVTKLGKGYHISPSTVNKYLQYTKAIESLKAEFPDFTMKILYGDIKISQNNLIALAKEPESEIIRIIDIALKSGKIVSSDFISSSRQINMKRRPVIPISSVKDMPAFDPDAYVSSLALTIPSWISSIKRTAQNSDMDLISLKAKSDLVQALDDLIAISTIIKNVLEEE